MKKKRRLLVGSWRLLKLAQLRQLSQSGSMRKVLMPFFALLVCFLTPGAHAALITLNPVATGLVREETRCHHPGCFNLVYSSTNPLGSLDYSSGYFPYYLENHSVGYLVFDLSGLEQNAQSATLELDLRYDTNANPNLIIRALDEAIVADLINNPAGTQIGAVDLSASPPTVPPLYSQLLDQFYAINSGMEVGTLSQSGPFDATYGVDLSSSALSLINVTTGVFGLGLTWQAHPVYDEYNSGSDLLSFNAPPRLVLRDYVVPLPGTLWLFFIAIPSLLLSQRIKSQQA